MAAVYYKEETDVEESGTFVGCYFRFGADGGLWGCADARNGDPDVFLMGQLERKKLTDYVVSGGDIQGPYGHIIEIEHAADGRVVKK